MLTQRRIFQLNFYIKIKKFKHNFYITEHKARQQTYMAQMHDLESGKKHHINCPALRTQTLSIKSHFMKPKC